MKRKRKEKGKFLHFKKRIAISPVEEMIENETVCPFALSPNAHNLRYFRTGDLVMKLSNSSNLEPIEQNGISPIYRIIYSDSDSVFLREEFQIQVLKFKSLPGDEFIKIKLLSDYTNWIQVNDIEEPYRSKILHFLESGI